MRNDFGIAALCLAMLAPGAALAADAPTFVTNKELKWVDLAEPKGATQAVLWGDAKSSENAVLVRWPFNTKVADQVRTQDVRILVLAGTFTTDVAGTYKEYGPSGVIVIPKGVKHTLGCEAAGECRFLVHHPGAVEVTKAK
jgi:quercetin dioxygenase-like cupin family protein